MSPEVCALSGSVAIDNCSGLLYVLLAVTVAYAVCDGLSHPGLHEFVTFVAAQLSL